MAHKQVDATAFRKVELALGELGSLSVPPCVAVQYLSKLAQGEFSPASVADIVQSEPALTAAILSLAQRRAAGPACQRHIVRLVLDRLDADEVRDLLLQTKVSAGFEIEFAQEQPALPARKDLILHSLAVACAARRIAEASDAGIEPSLAYTAGLLHDIGKLALQDLMPKSLGALTQEAEATKAGLPAVEHQHLGTSHALLGKQLAQRWRLPEPIKLAIWLHHGDVAAFAHAVPEAAVAVLVKAADGIARQAQIGLSGSFDEPKPLEHWAESLGVRVDALEQIRGQLPQEVKRRSACLGLETPQATAKYCDLIQGIAAQLSRRNTRLSTESRTLQAACGYLDFARQFLQAVRPNVPAVDMAEEFAKCWQRFFQTGAVCLYLTAGARDGVVDAAIVEALGHSHKVVVRPPQNGALLPKPIAGRFALLEAGNHIDWLLDQVGIDFNSGQARLVPLLSDGQVIGVMAFELNFPDDVVQSAQTFEMAASMAAAVLGLALATEGQEHWAQRLAQVEGASAVPAHTPIKTYDEGTYGADTNTPADPAVEALAEMAAGVAHELNNPLSVIAGRAQLLAQVESDGQKRHVLDVIHENAREASGVVDDLMSYAQPSPPRLAATAVSQIIEEAVQLAALKTRAEHVNVQVNVSPEVRDVLVDSAQVVVAIANVIANAIESYADPMGPVKITAESRDGLVRLQVNDLGCGMDEATVRKAVSPFFSAKPAGRKRGMGLAYASRLIRLNKGTLKIESRPEHGTAVTITLPDK